mgnify:CR=1 FL=1
MSELWKFDLRVLERNLKEGIITEKEYQAFLRELNDLEGKYDEVSLEELLPKALVKKLLGKEPDESGEGKE